MLRAVPAVAVARYSAAIASMVWLPSLYSTTAAFQSTFFRTTETVFPAATEVGRTLVGIWKLVMVNSVASSGSVALSPTRALLLAAFQAVYAALPSLLLP